MTATGNEITIKANNILHSYDDVGNGNIPVIFIHGFPFDKSSWQPQLDFLKTSHRAIAYDIRGFGKTTDTTGKVSITLFADDLVNLMDALKIQKAIICGLSMGGYIALNAVNRYPERFAALILSDTQCIADSPEAKEKRYQTIQQIETGGLADFAESFVQRVFCRESLENKKSLVDKIKIVILETSPSSVKATLAALAERDESCSALHTIAIPTLILCGKEDALTPPAQSEFLHKSIKNSVLHVLDHAGHLSNLEQAVEFNKHLSDFISRI